MKNKLLTPSLIAEIGCNFNGSLERAIFLSDLAIKSGADYLKYQFFSAENLINKEYYTKVLQLDNPNIISEINMLQLSSDEYKNLFLFNEKNGYKWGVSFFSVEDAKIFFEENKFQNFRNFAFIKIASGEITDYPLLEYLSKINKGLRLPVIISTGISNNKEIKKAITFFKKNCNIYLLHCIVEYPIQTDELNLSRIKYLNKKFKAEAGFSDHSLSIIPSILSLFFGSKIIEKHFTDSRNNKSADNPISMQPEEFIEIKKAINNIKKIYGDGKLKISQKELKELTYARKGLYASKELAKNMILTSNDIISRRPNLGRNDSKYYFKIINKKLNKDIKAGEPITLSDVE
ncbi:MAG: N-acetylneuraminate synthase family protein [Spirochaetota bacterium]